METSKTNPRSVIKLSGSLNTVRLAGLENKVDVIRDRWGIPHVYASNLQDLMFAAGFVQAQDRLWQMDFNRRLSNGKLSEIMGEPALETDRLVRRIGFNRAAKKESDTLPGEERLILESFSRGVNALIQVQKDHLPLEFSILGYKPSLWEPSDSLSFARFMGWTQSGFWASEILRQWTLDAVGPDTARKFLNKDLPGAHVTVPAGARTKGSGPRFDDEYRKLQQMVGVPAGGMSNNWAVDGEKSATGAPLLANDPHLLMQIPAVWHEAHLESPELRIIGACLPGIAGVILGHNGRIAWGVTNTMSDGDDLFVESFRSEDRDLYEFEHRSLNAEFRDEKIDVRGRADPLVEKVASTRHGPIISPAIRGEKRDLAIQSTAVEKFSSVKPIVMLWRASNWGQFREALRYWFIGSLNFVYADIEGNIGYQFAGLIPIRKKGYGLVPSPGPTGDYDWMGFVPFDELPSQYNPPTHWVATANNKVVDDTYPFFLGAGYGDYRIERIVQLLNSKNKLSTEDFRAMQGDLYSIPGKEIVQHMLSITPRDEEELAILESLKNWDGILSAESVAGCIVQVFMTELIGSAVAEKLGKDLTEFYLGRALHPLGVGSGVGPSWLLDKMKEEPNWFAGKTWPEAIRASFASALSKLRAQLGDDVAKWQWGRLHTQAFPHPLGASKELAPILNRGPVPIGGARDTLWYAGFFPYQGFSSMVSASYRQIIDLGDLNRSVAVLPTGQSGDPKSAHYADMIDLWRKVEYHPLLWERGDVDRNAESRLLMEPSH